MARLPDRPWRLALRVAYRLQRLYWFMARPRQPSAHVAVWHEGRLLLIRNSYKRLVSVPAGRVHRAESAAQAAARELNEEVGICVPPEELRPGITVVSREEHKEDHAHFFELELGAAPKIHIDGREVIWAGFETVPDALQLPLSDPVRQFLERRAEPP